MKAFSSKSPKLFLTQNKHHPFRNVPFQNVAVEAASFSRVGLHHFFHGDSIPNIHGVTARILRPLWDLVCPPFKPHTLVFLRGVKFAHYGVSTL